MKCSQVIIVHYHEIWLKGKNRHFFLSHLTETLRRLLGDVGLGSVRSVSHRLLVSLVEGAHLELALERLRCLLGVAYFAPAREISYARKFWVATTHIVRVARIQAPMRADTMV